MFQPPSPLAPAARRRPAWPVLVAGGSGVAGLAALALAGLAHPAAVLVCILVVGVVTALQAARFRRDLRAAEVAAVDLAPSPGAHSPILPYTAVLNALPDPVLVISAQEPDDLTGRRFVLANRAARKLFKIQREAGLLVTVIRDPSVLEAVDEALFGALDGEALYEPAGAQERTFHVFTTPLGVGADGAQLALLVLRDETEVRRVERTRADFLANASHELRTPLASLSGFIETLRGHAKTDEGAREKFLAIMSAQAERMSRLIDDLMSLSRIELNEHIAPADEVDLSLTVVDVVDAVSPLAREKGVRMEPRLAALGEAMVVGDRDQIVQVVQNLVDNALKYSPSGAVVRVVVGTGQTADAAAAARAPQSARLSLLTPDHGQERYASVSVFDEGAGMAREHLPRLTERFYRVEGQKSGERSGTGLGLAIVKHVINRHRGGLVVESAIGRGTVFTAYFPHVPAGAPARTSPSEPATVAETKVS